MNILITGGCGFLGSNIAAYGIKNGHSITVVDNLSRFGSNNNLEWLKSLGEFTYIHGDTRNKEDIERVIAANHFDAIFHGDDWKGSHMYDEIEQKLNEVGCDLVFLPHTDGTSSTLLTDVLRKIKNEQDG